jgi:hypothetical protein
LNATTKFRFLQPTFTTHALILPLSVFSDPFASNIEICHKIKGVKGKKRNPNLDMKVLVDGSNKQQENPNTPV